MSASPSAATRVGIVGFGAAGQGFVPAMRAHRGIELVAVADPSAAQRDDAAERLGVRTHASIDEMLADASLDAVYVATPTVLHAEHVLKALAARKHVLVEKPMAASVVDAMRMVEAAEAAGVVLMAGHSHSYDLPIQRMRDLIAGGTLGRVRMIHTWCYTDWMHRPRRPDELDPSQGGGVTFRQGSHQFDILRLLGGGLVKSVRARTFDWDPQRRSIGAHTVFLDFDDGAVATAVYNGYGGFSSMDLCFDISEWGLASPPASRATTRRAAGQSTDDELRAKQQRAKHAIPGAAPHQPFFGLTLVSCERGDIRQSPQGLTVHTADGRQEIELPTDRSPRDLVVAEFAEAIAGTRRALHDGRWGLANLEVCEAAMASSASGQEVRLKHQVSSASR